MERSFRILILMLLLARPVAIGAAEAAPGAPMELPQGLIVLQGWNEGPLLRTNEVFAAVRTFQNMYSRMSVTMRPHAGKEDMHQMPLETIRDIAAKHAGPTYKDTFAERQYIDGVWFGSARSIQKDNRGMMYHCFGPVNGSWLSMEVRTIGTPDWASKREIEFISFAAHLRLPGREAILAKSDPDAEEADDALDTGTANNDDDVAKRARTKRLLVIGGSSVLVLAFVTLAVTAMRRGKG